MESNKKVFELSKKWIYRNARPIDLARWQYHFENGSKENVIKALASYQNEDGGFGYALEADSWNPNSSPIQTWAAIEILREIDFLDGQHGIIQSILGYMDSGSNFINDVWQNTIPSNNDYPHASWWNWTENTLHYNPTANFCGFIIKYADRKSSLYNKGISVAKEAIDHFIKTNEINEIGDGHLNLCYLRLKQYCEEANEDSFFDTLGFHNKLLENIKLMFSNLQQDWCGDGVAFEFIRTYHDEFNLLPDKVDILEAVCHYLIKNQHADGTWNIPWNWNNYQEEWAISKNWWKAYGIIVNTLFLKTFGYIS